MIRLTSSAKIVLPFHPRRQSSRSRVRPWHPQQAGVLHSTLLGHIAAQSPSSPSLRTSSTVQSPSFPALRFSSLFNLELRATLATQTLSPKDPPEADQDLLSDLTERPTHVPCRSGASQASIYLPPLGRQLLDPLLKVRDDPVLFPQDGLLATQDWIVNTTLCKRVN